jgi:hypothetical protein
MNEIQIENESEIEETYCISFEIRIKDSGVGIEE